jgi:pimeloyl-[acyl-carrier protein] methyl ester esterase
MFNYQKAGLGMKILALSGWGQPHDTLADIVPNATHFDYADYKTIDEALVGIAKEANSHDAVIGWSLGGQLAVRAVAKGLMQPKKLVLIGVPFQFVHSDEIKIGMPRDKFQKFRDNYEKNAVRTLAKAWELIILNDKNPEHVRARLEQYNRASMMEKNWLHWLDMLDGFSCKDIDFSKFPPSLLVHGVQDAVVEHTQAHEFAKLIPQTKHIIIPDAGHAPHWHDTHAVKCHIEEYLHV